MLCSLLNRTLITILFIGSMCSSIVLPAATYDDQSTDFPDADSGQPIGILIADVDASLAMGREAQETPMRLIIEVHVENRSDNVITLAREQFQLLINGEPAEIGSVDSHSSLQRTPLQPGKSAEGWIGFGSIEYDGNEPSMILRWRPPGNSATDLKPTDIDLNEHFRRKSRITQTRLGPDECLLQISTHRDLDVLAIWAVAEVLKTAAAEKIGRVVFTADREHPPVIHEEFNLWLSGMIDASASANDLNLRFMLRTNPPFPRMEVQFQHIAVGGFTAAVNRQSGLYRRPIAVLPSAETAIANGLTPVYRHVATHVAVADLRHSNAGVRRAAMAGSIDRLTPSEASLVIDEILLGSPELQIEMAGYLNLVPGEKPVEALRVMSASENPQVSQTAIQSLIRSLNPATGSAMKELWHESSGRPELQNQILRAIIHLNSEQWTPLVADYVAERIEAAANSATTASTNHDPAADAEAHVDSFVTENGYSPSQQNLMDASLTFLRQQRHAGTLESLRRNLLKLSDPALQDIALSALLETRNAADEETIRECLDRRIRSEQITDNVRIAAIQLPSPQWTEMIRNDLNSNSDPNSQTLSANALLRCASATQLDQIIDNFDSLPDNAKQQALRYLAAMDHPRWKIPAGKLIEAPLPISSERNTPQRSSALSTEIDAIRLLAADASEESIIMLTKRLERAIVELDASAEVPHESRLYVHRLIENISMFAHPECRRSLNRTSRCGNQDLRQKAGKQIEDAMERSLAQTLLRDRVRNMNRNPPRLEDNEETIALYDDCIDADPWHTETYIRRSSVLMHLNRFEETMNDLRTASRLSPENMDVESMIALCQIRLGETEAGLKFAEELVTMAPRNLSSLYNGACSYSRALENQNISEDDKQRYGDRAIELIRLTIATGFADSSHLQSDEDLVALHTHPEWLAVVDEINSLHAEKLKNPQE